MAKRAQQRRTNKPWAASAEVNPPVGRSQAASCILVPAQGELAFSAARTRACAPVLVRVVGGRLRCRPVWHSLGYCGPSWEGDPQDLRPRAAAGGPPRRTQRGGSGRRVGQVARAGVGRCGASSPAAGTAVPCGLPPRHPPAGLPASGCRDGLRLAGAGRHQDPTSGRPAGPVAHTTALLPFASCMLGCSPVTGASVARATRAVIRAGDTSPARTATSADAVWVPLMSGFATPLTAMTGADKQVHRIGDHWARCLLGVPAVHNGGFGRRPQGARRGRE